MNGVTRLVTSIPVLRFFPIYLRSHAVPKKFFEKYFWWQEWKSLRCDSPTQDRHSGQKSILVSMSLRR